MRAGFLTGVVAGVAAMAAVGWGMQLWCRPAPDPRVPQLEAALLRATGDLAAERRHAAQWRALALPGLKEESDAGRPDDLRGDRIPPTNVPER